MANGEKRCALCGSTEGRMVTGKDGGYVCFSCVENAFKKIEQDKHNGKKLDAKLPANIKPSEIKAILDEHVIGQEMAKKAISVAISDHIAICNYIAEHDGNPPIDIQRSNILLLGPTGSGKTEMARVLAKHFGLPLGISDATTLTESGYLVA